MEKLSRSLVSGLWVVTMIVASPSTSSGVYLKYTFWTDPGNTSYFPVAEFTIRQKNETSGLSSCSADYCCRYSDLDNSNSCVSCCFSTDALFGVLFALGSLLSVTGNLLAIIVWSSYLNNYLTILYLNLSICDFIISISGNYKYNRHNKK